MMDALDFDDLDLNDGWDPVRQNMQSAAAGKRYQFFLPNYSSDEMLSATEV